MTKYYSDRVEAIQNAVSGLEGKVAEQKERAERAVCEAEEVCPRLVTERSRQSIKSEMEKLRRRIDQEMPGRAEQERIEAEYLEAMQRYEKTRQIIQSEQDALEVSIMVIQWNLRIKDTLGTQPLSLSRRLSSFWRSKTH